jgi:hypothetical protein
MSRPLFALPAAKCDNDRDRQIALVGEAQREVLNATLRCERRRVAVQAQRARARARPAPRSRANLAARVPV